MKIFCLSIYNNNYEKFKKLNLIPVGLGDENFDSHWLNDKGAQNISSKNKNYTHMFENKEFTNFVIKSYKFGDI